MPDLLWQKPGIAIDARIQDFLAGDDVVLDREFFLHDIAASRAHAQGLQRIGLLSGGELAGLERELDALAGDFRSGAFVLDACFEDGHSAIEARLVERLGEAGKKLHAGRSRTAPRWGPPAGGQAPRRSRMRRAACARPRRWPRQGRCRW